MCQQTAMRLQIEQMYSQGMPKKIGKTLQYKLMKKLNSNQNNYENSGNKFCKTCISSITTTTTTTTATTLTELKELTTSQSNANEFNENNNEHFNNNNYKIINSEKLNIVKSHNIKNDMLAITTQWTRIACNKFNEISENLHNSYCFKILTRTTQPAHVIAVGTFLLVMFAIWPNILESESNRKLNCNDKKSGLALVAYLGAFATHFGAQIWMTFVSGLSLYFALPRHTFGLCQQILFPKYFALNSMLSICTLILYIKVIGGHWEFSSYIQVAALTICAVIEVAVRLYLAPPLLRLMREKHKFEIGIGSGQEVGHLDQKDLIKCPHYQKIHKSFRRIHMTVAIGNMTVLVCMFLHLNYIASKISVTVS